MTLLTRKVKKEIIEEIIIGAKCDFCSQPIPDEFVEYEGYGKITIMFGYPSKFDLMVYKGQVCDFCFAMKLKDKLRGAHYG